MNARMSESKNNTYPSKSLGHGRSRFVFLGPGGLLLLCSETVMVPDRDHTLVQCGLSSPQQFLPETLLLNLVGERALAPMSHNSQGGQATGPKW